jgi:acyl-CoA thioesterase
VSASHYPEISAALRARIQADPWAQSLGIEYLDLRKGYCRLGLKLQPHMVNFQGYPHGGTLFSLADVAFGAACNARGGSSVGLNVTISYLTAVKPGSRLVAEARARKQGRRIGFYDVTITTDDGTIVAYLHCLAHRASA